MSLMKQQSDVTHTIRQSEIPALLDSWVTPSVKTLGEKKSLYFRKKHNLLNFTIV